MLHLLKQYSIYIILGIGLLIMFLFLPIDKKEKEGEIHIASSASDTEQDAGNEILTDEPGEVIVDVKGAVVSPGIYKVDSDARIHDVIEMAGGITEEADENQVNFAQKVQDEMVIFVPEKGSEMQMEVTGSTSDDKVRINYATMEELQALQGIGPSKAEAIIQHREENGFFQSAEDLLQVSGIGEKTLENIKDDIQVP